MATLHVVENKCVSHYSVVLETSNAILHLWVLCPRKSNKITIADMYNAKQQTH